MSPGIATCSAIAQWYRTPMRRKITARKRMFFVILVWLGLSLSAASFAQDAVPGRSPPPAASEAPPSPPATEQPPAQSSTSAGEDEQAPEELLVTGEHPGPGLWRASRDGRELWILGLVDYFPKRATWRSKDVESIVAQADAILPDRAEADLGIGPIRTLRLVASVFGPAFSSVTAKHEAGKTARELLDPQVYRFSALRRATGFKDNELERAVFARAGLELTSAMQKILGIDDARNLKRQVGRIVDRNKKSKVDISYDLPDRVKKLIFRKETIQQFIEIMKLSVSHDDVDCFKQDLDNIEEGLPIELTRARAWALGDVDALVRLPPARRNACQEQATASLGAVFDRIKTDPQWRAAFEGAPDSREVWRRGVLDAVGSHRSSFLAIGIGRVLGPNGVLMLFEKNGYQIEPPGNQPRSG